MTEAASGDSYVRRFLLEDLDIRGAVVRLGDAWRDMQARRGYSPALRDLVGRMACVTTVIAGNLKQSGRVTFQLQGHGPVGLMVIDCDETLNLRGYARGEVPQGDSSPSALFGDGHLMLTLDVAGLDKPYQSYVPLEGDTLTEMFRTYLRQSDQQDTALWLAAGAHSAGCLFLQKLPDADQRDADGWSRCQQLAATLNEDELLELDAESLLLRLFHEETVRVFEARPVRHDWPADPDKVRTMLLGLGRDEVEQILAEHGEVRICDDLSNHEYVFDAEEIRTLFENPPTLQ